MRFEVTVLGSNGAVPTAQRQASAHFFRSEETDILLDCGEGTQIQLLRAGLGFAKVSLILITHLHGDHYFGLPGLLTSQALSGRVKPLHLISPPGLRDKLVPILELDRWELPFPLTFQEHAATDFGPLKTSGELEIFSFPLRHRTPTNGYLIREKHRPANILKEKIAEFGIPWQAIPAIKAGGDFLTASGERIANGELTAPASPPRSYAYCTDTTFFAELAEWIRGVDLLYHEATFLHDMADEARDKGHSTARQAATIARQGGVRTLIIGHFSARYRDVNEHQREARAIFPNSFSVADLRRYIVPFSGRVLPYST